jgi:hypothetical protein
MTLDEARTHLGVTPVATVEEIRDAFRRRARELHPDLHPEADLIARAHLAQKFDAVREARDILVRYTADPLRKPPPTNRRPRPEQKPTFARTEQPSSEERKAPRVTMRFDEFVAWADAAGFGAGSRSSRYVDWVRIIAWSSLLAVTLAIVGGAVIFSTVFTPA